MKNKNTLFAVLLTLLFHCILIFLLASNEEFSQLFTDKQQDCNNNPIQAVAVNESMVLAELKKIDNEEKYYADKNASMQSTLDDLQKQHRTELKQQKVRLQHQTEKANKKLEAITDEKYQQQQRLEKQHQIETEQQQQLEELQQKIGQYEKLNKNRRNELKQLNREKQDLKNTRDIAQKQVNNLQKKQRKLEKKQREQLRKREKELANQRMNAQREAEKQRLIKQRKTQAVAQKRLADEKKQREKQKKQQQQAEQRAKEKAAEQAELQKIQNQEKRVIQEGIVLKATNQIKNKIERIWLRPENLPKGLACLLEIRTLPSGDVVSARVIKSSGNVAFDGSAEGAVYDASPLPVPSDKSLYNGKYADGTTFDGFRVFQLNFKPN